MPCWTRAASSAGCWGKGGAGEARVRGSTDDKGDAAGEMARLGLVNLEDADHAVCRMHMGR